MKQFNWFFHCVLEMARTSPAEPHIRGRLYLKVAVRICDLPVPNKPFSVIDSWREGSVGEDEGEYLEPCSVVPV